jgi:hypothetical protein
MNGADLFEKRDYDIHFQAEFETPDNIAIYISFAIENSIVAGFTVNLEFYEDQELTTDVLHEAIEHFIGENMATQQQIDRLYLRVTTENYNTGMVH